MRDQHGKVRQAFAARLPHRHRIGRRRGLKAHAEEDDLPRGFLAGVFQRVIGIVNDSHIASIGAGLEEIVECEPGTRSMSP